jgi:hypothetical protein
VNWWVLGFGVAVELFGLTLTGVGLFHTWRDHAEGQPFWPAVRTEFSDWLRRVAGRPRPVAITGGIALGRLEFSGSAHGVRPWDLAATIEGQMAQLRDKVDSISAEASRAHFAAEEVRKALDRRARALEEDLAALRTDLSGRLRAQVLHGLPLAVLGVILAGSGTLIQFLAAIPLFS